MKAATETYKEREREREREGTSMSEIKAIIGEEPTEHRP